MFLIISLYTCFFEFTRIFLQVQIYIHSHKISKSNFLNSYVLDDEKGKSMSKIIPFNPQNIGTTHIEHQHQQQKQEYIPEYPEDSFEFVDEIIEDEPSFMDKIKTLLGKNNASDCNNLEATPEMKNEAIELQFKAIRTKQRVSDLIAIAQGDYNCSLVNNKKGIYITFEEDNLGRMVMIESDKDGNIKRQTTFYQGNEQIHSIESADSEKTVTKIIYFNYSDKYFEIRKQPGLSCLGNYQEEIYSFRHNKPESLTIKKGNIFKTDVKKETYFF